MTAKRSEVFLLWLARGVVFALAFLAVLALAELLNLDFMG